MRQITNIQSSSHPLLSSFMEIYHEAFPSSEKQTDQVIMERLDSGREILYAFIDDTSVLAIALLFFLTREIPGKPDLNQDFILLDYFAVEKEFRGKGIGSEFLTALLASLSFERSGKILIIEAEDPDVGDYTTRIKRIRFYEKHGAVLADKIIYSIPAMGDAVVPTPMKLMFYPADKLPDVEKEGQELIAAIHQQVYGRVMDL